MHCSYIDLLTSKTPIPPPSSSSSSSLVVNNKKEEETETTPMPTTRTLNFYFHAHICKMIHRPVLFSVSCLCIFGSNASCSSSAFTYERKSSELAKGSGKHIGEAGASSSPQVEEEDKGSNTIFRQKETANQPAAESFSHEGCAIRPGMFASNLKFGGCGSYPELPWVSTTGPGPNGKTISGVTYKYDRNQIKIVCACHGSHMTPEEFIQHASADASNQENNTSLASFPASNPAASAQN